MLDTIKKIIHLNLCPLKGGNQGNDYYESKFRQLGIVEEKFAASYSVNFKAPLFSSKVKYYKRLIDNDIATCLNDKLFVEPKENLILYYRKNLQDKVTAHLSDIKNVIEKEQLDLDIVLSIHDYAKDLLHNECTYIYHYMILALIRCYLEFQHHFIESIESDKQLSIDDFFVQMLQWKAPEKIGIEEIKRIEIEPEKPTKKSKTEQDANKPLSFTYTKSGKNTENITNLMDCLKRYGFIASDTSITDFKHVFSGKKVDNPIRWTTYFGGLLDLFRQLNQNHLIKFDGKNIYRIVCACFVDKDGTPFVEEQFNNGKISKLITEQISKAVQLMK